MVEGTPAHESNTNNSWEDRLPQDLIDKIKSGNCIAFVGAGFSFPANIPVWKTLIRRILFFEGSKIETVFRDYNIKKEVLEKELIPYRDEIDKLIEVGTGDKLDQAAQMIEDVFEICLPDRGMEILNKCFSELLTHSQYTLEKDTQMKKRLNALMQIPFKAILTTNFDTIIPGGVSVFDKDKKYQAINKILLDPPMNFGQQLLSGHSDKDGVFYLKPPVLQLHGCISSDRTPYLVCTRKGYRKLLHQDESYQNFLRSVMSNYTILYLGFSFSDNYLNDLRASVLTMLGKTMESDENIPLAYAITHDKLPGDMQFYRRHEGVCFLNYNVSVDNSFPLGDKGADEDEDDNYLPFPVGRSDDANPHHEFDEILETIKDKTSPQILFAKLLASKHVLWMDKSYKSRDFHASNLRTLMSKLPRQYGKNSLIKKMSGGNSFTKEEKDELVNYDLVITDYGEAGKSALQVLKAVTDLRDQELNYVIDLGVRGDVIDEDYVISSPIVLVHDDKYISGVSESRKGQLIRCGAADYTTDNESLTMAIVSALSVMEHGNNRGGTISIPGSCSSTKKKRPLENNDNNDTDMASRLLTDENPTKRKKDHHNDPAFGDKK